MRGARRYLSAGVEQALWSILNLGVNLALARYMTPHGYGGFVFWTSVGFVLASLQNALTVCHIQVLAPGGPTAVHRLRTERLMHAVNAIYLAVAAALILGLGVIFGGDGSLLTPEAALFVPAYLLQQYVRALNFSRARPTNAAIQTAAVLVLGAGLLAAEIIADPEPSTGRVLLALGAAYAIVGVVGFVAATYSQFRAGISLDLRRYARFAHQSGWIFLGVSSVELLARFYTFAVVAMFGQAPLAVLAATQILLRPMPLLAAVWTVVARPDLSRQRDAGDWLGYGRKTRNALVGGLVVSVGWSALVVAAWPLISHYLFAGKYAEFGWMVALWGVYSTLGYAQGVISSAIQVMREFKALALANAAASIAAAAGILILLRLMGYGAAPLGMALGQVVDVAVMGGLLLMGLRRARAAGALR